MKAVNDRRPRRWSGTLRLGLLLTFLFALSVGGVRADEEAGSLAFTGSNLPPGWSVEKGVVVPRTRLAAFEGRLGGRLDALTNQVLSVNGLRTQVNTLTGTTEKDAEAICATLAGARGEDFVARSQRKVYEVVGTNRLLAQRVWAALGLDRDREATWKVAFRAACVDSPDYTAANRIFNLLLELEKNPGDEVTVARIRAETEGWVFGNSLALRHSSAPDLEVEWTFESEPLRLEKGPVSTRYVFEDPPRIAGIPYVNVRGRIRVKARYAPDGPKTVEGDTDATTFWPSGDAAVKKVAAGAVEGAGDATARLLALLRYVNEHIRYGGEVGSRDGTLTVLERGLGRCWDRCDVLVTLCRAVGLPAREVAGWVPVLGAGHIWTEVHLGDRGWLPVDATTPWLGTSVDYVPFFCTRDGRMPVLYLGMPEVERVE